MQRIDRKLVAVMGVSVVFSLVLLSRSEISHWRSPLTLWHHVLEISPGAIVPRNNLALTYVLIGEFDLAREHIALLPEPFHSRLNQMLLEEMASQGSP